MSQRITFEPKETNPGGSVLAKHNISATDVNDILNGINSHAAEIETVETNLENNSEDITENTAKISTNTTDIGTLKTGVANAVQRANHFGVQAATTITQDSTHRFATDAEKTIWNAKADVAAAQVTLTALTFTKDSVSGTVAAPITGNITGVTTGALLGVIVLVIHNSTTAPTFDSKFKKLSGSGDYVTGVINYIFCEYINSTQILYSINQLV